MRMNKNQKRSSGSGSSDFENKLEFVNDSFEMMETDRVHGVSGGATTASVSTTSSEDTVQSVSSGGNRMSSSDLSQLLSDGIPVVGVLHRERVQSFEGKGWPYSRNKCTPEKLALAGFEYLQTSNKAVKCVFCGLVLENLEVVSDPWQLHEIRKPACSYVRLGKRNCSSEYSYKETLDLYLHAKIRTMADLYVATEVENKSILESLTNDDGAISI